MPTDKKLLGRSGEAAAAEYLKRRKYRILGLNYSCRFGEIDVIAADRRYVVFVEVKQRKNADFAAPREFVTPAKQRRLIAAASLWLQNNETELQPRFDVIEVYAPGGKAETINHIENAFEVN